MAQSKLEKLIDGIYENTDLAFIEIEKTIKSNGGEISFEPINHTKRVRFVYLDGYYALKGDYVMRIRIPDYDPSETIEVLFEHDDSNDEYAWHSFNWQDEFVSFNVCEMTDGIRNIRERKLIN